MLIQIHSKWAKSRMHRDAILSRIKHRNKPLPKLTIVERETTMAFEPYSYKTMSEEKLTSASYDGRQLIKRRKGGDVRFVETSTRV